MKKIIDTIKAHPDFKRALEVAPEEDREKIVAVVEKLAGTFQDFADKLDNITKDPDALRAAQEVLKKEVKKR